MYWPGDSLDPIIRRRWLRPSYVWGQEVRFGRKSGLPWCCIIWYVLTAWVCMLTRRDAMVLPIMFGDNGWEDFRRLDYYRCPRCRVLERKAKVLWFTKKEER